MYNQSHLCFSKETFNELEGVLARNKFSRYLLPEERELTKNVLLEYGSFFEITETVDICRDPKDNKFLELALSVEADVIISRDQDLLVLNPFQGIPIMDAQDFVDV